MLVIQFFCEFCIENVYCMCELYNIRQEYRLVYVQHTSSYRLGYFAIAEPAKGPLINLKHLVYAGHTSLHSCTNGRSM